MSHAVTIKDIARELGVSPSTVSRALKDHPDISTATKKQVKELVEKLKYKPNAIALSLRSQKTNVISVIVPQIVHHFFSSVISGIEEVAQANGYNVMIFQSNEQYERELEIMQAIEYNRAEGALVSISKTTRSFSHFRELAEKNFPIVFFDRVCEELETDKVIVDDFNGAMNAVEYLIKTGCKRIAHLAAPQNLLIGYHRKRGYISALEKNGIEVDDDLIVKCDTIEEAAAIIPGLMGLKDPPDGIFAVNDMTAAGSVNALKKLGYKIPEKVSVIGFTDGLVSTVTDPPLTTISQHGFEIGKKSAEMLLDRIMHPDSGKKPTTEVIKTELIVRGTTRSLS
ncbi:MAG: LacI family transcriptional regulator [Bacteroidales bacterium]|nr:LacI family transcriptional regulator [Bacteroidales bacterium]